MSFGASPSDIIIVVTFCRALYRKCRDAGGEYDEISREVRGLHTVLKHLKYEIEATESPLKRDQSLWGRQLAPIIGNCDFTLNQLDGLLQKYGRLSDGGSSPSSPRVLWDKVRFGSNEMDTLGEIRVKLISHKTSLTLFLDTIQLHQSGQMATTLNNHGGQLDIILDKVDTIAAKMGQRSGSILTSYDDDDKEVWKQFRRELVAEGFSSDVLTQHKDVLRAYIREIDQKGLLDEMPPHRLGQAQQRGVNPQRWLDDVQSSPPPSEGPPPTFDSLHTPTDNCSTKELVGREENMKFFPSMKFERPKPETLHSDLERRMDSLMLSRDLTELTPRTTPAVPKLITSNEKDEKDGQYYYNTDGSSDENSESEESSEQTRAPKMGLVIKTSDLFKPSQGLKLLLPASPTSFRSSQGSFGEDDATRSIAIRPKNPGEFGSSPSRPGAIPIPSANPRSSSDRFGASPITEPLHLAPDEHGNEIPPDAKWTRINRRLVSPEVLEQDHRRYEARPEWVAVLGVLSRAEIESYAARTARIREARRRRSEAPPPQPPRPVTIPRTDSKSGSLNDTPSTSDSESSDSTSHRRHRYRNRAPRSYTPSDINVPVSGYPNPFGQPIPTQSSNLAPPSSNWSPASAVPQPARMPNPPQNISSGEAWASASRQSQGGVYYTPKEKERERQRSSRRHYSHHSHSGRNKDRDRDRERERDRDRERRAPPPQKVSRWKENLTAASIGGAAVSLLNVLTEAAEGF